MTHRRIIATVLWAIVVIAITFSVYQPTHRVTGRSVPMAEKNDINAAMFLLMRTAPAGPQPVFVCPANAEKWDYNSPTTVPTRWADWDSTLKRQ
jgi:hypothetical protein